MQTAELCQDVLLYLDSAGATKYYKLLREVLLDRSSMDLALETLIKAGLIESDSKAPRSEEAFRLTEDGKTFTAGMQVGRGAQKQLFCNRHKSCCAADEAYKELFPNEDIPPGFHCYDDDCEDCFGK